MQFAVPYYRTLSSHRGWERESRWAYSVVRLHFASVSDGLARRLCVGPAVAEATVTHGVTEEVEIERSISVASVNETRTLQELIVESEVFSEISSSIAAGVNPTGFKVESSLASTLSEKFSQRSRLELGQTTARTKTTSETVRVKIRVDGDSTRGQRIFIASNYRECVETIYLAYFDVLRVEYHHRYPWLPRKRVKVPQFQESWNKVAIDRRPNVSMPLNWPIGTIRYWKYVPDSHPVYTQSQYPDTDIDFTRVEVVDEPPPPQTRRLPFTGPSLYKVSNSAFERRYADFKRVVRKASHDEDESDGADDLLETDDI